MKGDRQWEIKRERERERDRETDRQRERDVELLRTKKWKIFFK